MLRSSLSRLVRPLRSLASVPTARLSSSCSGSSRCSYFNKHHHFSSKFGNMKPEEYYRYKYYHHHHHRRGRFWGMVLAFAAGGAVGWHWSKHKVVEAAPKFAATDSRPFSFADAVDRVMPSVVHIVAEAHGVWTERQSHGSGFIVSEDGLILTNAHVVNGQPDEILVSLQNGKSYSAVLVNCDELSDIALLKINTNEKLPVAELGDSDKLRVGDWAIAVGSPLNLSNTVTAGIISSVKRLDTEIGMDRKMFYVQTDAAIVQGNSGGPLVDAEGKVVAVNSMTVANAQGFSFAIPINIAKEIMGIWRSHGVIRRPFIGIRMTKLDSRVREEMPPNLLPKVDVGVVVVHVFPNSPAAKVGVAAGDVIVSIDGKPVLATRDIVSALGFSAGKTCDIQVVRNEKGKDKHLTFKVTSVPLPSQK